MTTYISLKVHRETMYSEGKLPERKSRMLYRHLEKRNGDKVDNDVFLAELAARALLTFIQRGITDYTAHDIHHSERVIEYVNLIIDVMEKNGATFSEYEMKLLYVSGWLHDIGNLKKGARNNHAEESCRMLKKLRSHGTVSRYLLHALEFIIGYHQSNMDLSRIPDAPVYIERDKVRLRLLAAIFRLADNCDMGFERADPMAYLLLKEDFNRTAQKHWEANHSIQSVQMDARNHRIIITIAPQRGSAKKAAFLIKKFKKEFKIIKPFLGAKFTIDNVEDVRAPRY